MVPACQINMTFSSFSCCSVEDLKLHLHSSLPLYLTVSYMLICKSLILWNISSYKKWNRLFWKMEFLKAGTLLYFKVKNSLTTPSFPDLKTKSTVNQPNGMFLQLPMTIANFSLFHRVSLPNFPENSLAMQVFPDLKMFLTFSDPYEPYQARSCSAPGWKQGISNKNLPWLKTSCLICLFYSVCKTHETFGYIRRWKLWILGRRYLSRQTTCIWRL